MSAKPIARETMTRREFCVRAAEATAACAAGSALVGALQAGGAALAQGPTTRPLPAGGDLTVLPEGAKGNLSDHEAMFYDKLPDQRVRCQVCPRQCEVADGGRGWCGVRRNDKGTYKTLVYGKICSAHVDPIEKKPLYHYLPGTTALSVATVGCNFECKFCQNWEISQARPEQVPAGDLPPERLVAVAQERRTPTLAFTYTEPVVFCEYVHDSAKLARSVGVGSAMISNGFIQEAPMRRLCEQLTAVKVDFKGYSDNFYRDVCGGRLDPVLKTLQLCRKIGIHLEIVVLVIPTLNDAPGDLKAMTKWIVDGLGPDVPVHFSRFNPLYRLKNLPPTPVATLEQAHKIARDGGINYVYVGNVPMHAANHTYCPKCSTMLIKRLGYVVRENVLTDQGACPKCGTKVPGVFKPKDAFAARNA